MRVVYLSATLSLAALEILVHLQAGAAATYVARRCFLPSRRIRRIRASQIPDGWTAEPATALSRAIGDAFVREGKWLGLLVPSVVVPTEYNLLLNPLHPEAGSLRLDDPMPFAFDPRLLI